jgi:hypothetical protein
VAHGLQIQPAAKDTFSEVGPALTAAIKVVLVAGEGSRGSGGRKQPRQQVLTPLLSAACAGAMALTGKSWYYMRCAPEEMWSSCFVASRHQDMRSQLHHYLICFVIPLWSQTNSMHLPGDLPACSSHPCQHALLQPTEA